MMSLLTSQHINRMCSQHTPKQYHRLVTGYTKHIASWPCDLDSVILFHAFYEKIFPNLCNKIQSPISSDEEREKMIIDMMSLLSLQRNKKWDDTIIDVLDDAGFLTYLLCLSLRGNIANIKIGCNWLLGSLEMHSKESILSKYDAHVYFYMNLLHESPDVKSKTLFALANMADVEEANMVKLLKTNIIHRLYAALNDEYNSNEMTLILTELWQHVALLICNLLKYSTGYVHFSPKYHRVLLFLLMQSFGKCLQAYVDVKRTQNNNLHLKSSSIVYKKEKIVNKLFTNIFRSICHITCNHNYLIPNVMAQFEIGSCVFGQEFIRGLLNESSIVRLAALDAINYICDDSEEYIDRLLQFGLLKELSQWFCIIEDKELDEVIGALQLLIIIMRISDTNKQLIVENQHLLAFICLNLASEPINIWFKSLYAMNLCLSSLQSTVVEAINFFDEGKFIVNFCELLGKYGDISSEMTKYQKQEFIKTFKHLAKPCTLSLIPEAWIFDTLLQNGFVKYCKSLKIVNNEHKINHYVAHNLRDQGLEDIIFYIDYLYSKCNKKLNENDNNEK